MTSHPAIAAGAATRAAGLERPGGPKLRSADVSVILLATDADWLYADIDATLSGGGTEVYRVRAGADVEAAILHLDPDLVILDLQIGNVGGMATCMNIRIEQDMGRLADIPVLMLLDRDDDVFLARRSKADGWLIKPVEPFRLRRAVKALQAGDTYFQERRQVS